MDAVTHFDLAVIGTGSGNSVVDDRFADWRVAVLEEGTFGGTCLNVGCIPTKMFVYPADLARHAQDGPRLGVETSYAGARWREVRDRVFGRIDPIAASGRDYRVGLPNVEVFGAHATSLADHTLDTGTGETITADQVVVAAGSRVDVAPIPGLEDVPFHTSDTVMRLDELPARLAIIGGGFVAAEFAHVFSALGSRVTQVHRGPALLRAGDAEISTRFTGEAVGQWDVRLSTTVEKVARRGDGVVLLLSDDSEVEADVLLMATGRVPNTDRLGLEHTSIALDGDVVAVDAHQRSVSTPHVWALGDAANTWQLKHVANAEARTVQHNLLHPDDLVTTDHRFVPSAVFTHPQVASVGLPERAAREQGLEVTTAVQDYADVAYGWAMEDRGHVVKLVAQGEQLVGAHVLGPQASILIQPLVQGMSLGSTVSEMSGGQYWIHPSLAEVVENALLKL
jgi:mycothione reductase